ncbi:uncharacterized protein KY384_000736 [Bacidia gigantensis]|uniref:uncharacterized protein n=1 Tax=Bacidia gigantensis TaxID=2732470 RepID=UPI001D045149|nr:uncharacterized protein KY384_000736 [Bacidia gigantensis]KAG8525974.1 hypothetical protein KY384_000736 [Bacidia gigantensis]
MATVCHLEIAPTKRDVVREHEMLRYYSPPDTSTEDISVHRASSPDTNLTALAQLVIGKKTQYFIAEATKTLNLLDTSKSGAAGDELWFGCGSVDKSGRLCERTLEVTAEKAGQYPIFTVPNLAEDPRFNELPFVTDGPQFRYYAGTPLKTKRGINIGSLFILDSVPRPHLTPEQVDLLGTLAQTVVKHMEVSAEAEERRKTVKLSVGINAFVQGKSTLPAEQSHGASNRQDQTLEGTHSVASRAAGMNSDGSTSQSGPDRPDSRHHSHFERHVDGSSTNQQAESSHDDSDSIDETQTFDDSGHRATLIRASNILYEALGIQPNGGVVFFDSTTRRRHNTDLSSQVNNTEYLDNNKRSTLDSETAGVPTTNAAVPLAIRETEPRNFHPIDDRLLHSLLRRYPRGKLWSFDTDSTLSSSEEDALTRSGADRVGELSGKKRYQETVLLRKYFPDAKQLLFYGLWDAGSSRWFCASFAWTTKTSAHQIFSVETELSFFVAFGNSIMAQVSRLSSMAADRQKADFIGSISHELRSPLHGILASAEFLADVTQDASQSSLVDTISSCGRTLLDTINHILDYSKINSFERTWYRSHKRAKIKGHLKNQRTMADKDAPQMLNVYAVVDVASIAEEVVEGVYAGQVYQDISSTDATSLSHFAKVGAREQGLHVGTESRRICKEKDVEIIFDFQPGNYCFVTQPGALKRVIMNIFGNALKYTQKGSIHVKLSLDDKGQHSTDAADGADLSKESILQIQIIDTGKGISRQYLRTSLFKPFCQEDVLASGTGLGLSIVRSIITMLSGTIDVQSDVGIGTEVDIKIPLSRVPGADTPVATPSSGTASTIDDSISVLERDYQSVRVALFGFEWHKTGTGPALQACLEHWLGLRAKKHEADLKSYDVRALITDDQALHSLPPKTPVDLPILVLCKSTNRNQVAKVSYGHSVMEFVSKPCGPRKLAKALRVCLDRSQGYELGFGGPTTPMPAERTSNNHHEDLPELNQLTLQSNEGHDPIEIQTNEEMSASHSRNALMAVDDSVSKSASGDTTAVGADGATQFPFPSQNNGSSSPDVSSNNTSAQNGQFPSAGRSTLEVAEHQHAQSPLSNAPHGAEKEQPGKRSPRLLLVDDNKINLRLLQASMRKRKYDCIDTADDGLLAVQAAEASEDGYDIIFMDISMPIMNGFEATRAIRDIECQRDGKSRAGDERSSAFVIALTGLASGEDQAEAFASGIDLFLTKPVSFKRIAKLLDNWEAHGTLTQPEEDT